MSPKKKFLTALLGLFFVCYILMMTSILSREEATVAGWDYNTTRDTSLYVLKQNFSAHIIPEQFCVQDTLLTVFVCSAPKNFEARNAIRQTWGQERNVSGFNVSFLFLIGETPSLLDQEALVQESKEHNDLIQENFVDSYNNLTLKSVMMLKLATNFCANSTKYILKIDDDMLVNIDLIVNMLIGRNTTTELLVGRKICGARPIKDSSNKWYSPTYMYEGSYYPNYLSGTGYLMSVDVAERLFRVALTTPIFHLEDVFLTGICAKKVNIKPRNNSLFTFQKLNDDLCILSKVFTAHRFPPEKIRKFHKTIRNREGFAQECDKQKHSLHFNNWMLTNVLKFNRTRRKSKCE